MAGETPAPKGEFKTRVSFEVYEPNLVLKKPMEKRMFFGSTPNIFENAKRLRNELTPSEIICWSLLKQHFSEYKFRRQHPLAQYIADFYCHKLKLVIEIDGGIHLTREARENDEIRDEFMRSLGLKVIRFSNDEVCKNGQDVVTKLKAFIDSLNTKMV